MTDDAIAEKTRFEPTYFSKIRTGQRNASARLVKALEQLEEALKTDVRQPSLDLPWDELLEARVVGFAKTCEMSLGNFAVECLRRFAEQTAIAVKTEMEQARKLGSRQTPIEGASSTAADAVATGAKLAVALSQKEPKS